MLKGIIGKKIGMTQIFTENGDLVPVTVIEAGPCPVVSKKTFEKDGYCAVQIGFSDTTEKRIAKPVKGQFDKASVAYKKYLREFRTENCDDVNIGDIIKIDIFEEGQKVDVTGTSKGKGFAGTIKRWGTHRGPMAHGSGYHRGQGSMGSCSTPSRVMKGKVMPGHMGSERITVQNLSVVKIDAEKNLIAVKGAIPGPKGSVVLLKSAVKSK
ncbi:MAG: 50S ribosomal protein L3 [Ruminococcaceae bacterium]|nr:50S ribosomal protein L3 [Oscillospiraceae bacterium]